jgi:hypothetical protein
MNREILQEYLTGINSGDYTTGISHWYKFNTDHNNSATSTNTPLYNYATSVADGTMFVGSSISTSNIKEGTGSIYLPNFTTLPSFTLSSTAVSISFWVYPTAFNNQEVLFSFGTAFSTQQANIQCQFDSTGNLYTITNDQSTFGTLSSQYNIKLNTWLHMTHVLTSANTWSIYYNGVLFTTVSSGITYPGTQSYAYNHIGAQTNDNNTVKKANYYMDDFRIYNGTALTAAQVKSMYNSYV